MSSVDAIAVVAVLGHRDVDDLADAGREGRVHVVGRDERLLQVLVHHRRRRFAIERRAAGDQVIHRRAQRIDVGAEIDVDVAADLLGRDVVGRAVGFAGFALGGVLVVRRARQTEVGQLRDALRGEEDVLGLDVAVDQAALVGVGERVGDLDRDVQRFGLGEVRPRRPAAAA